MNTNNALRYYEEDNLWSKYRKLKQTCETVALDPHRYAACGPRKDDSGRVVDMTEVFHNLFLGDQ